MQQSFTGGLLFWLIALPLAGDLALRVFPRPPALRRVVTLACTSSVFAIALVLWSCVHGGEMGAQFPEGVASVPAGGAQPLLAADAISAMLIGTATLLFALYAIAAWRQGPREDRRRSPSVLLLEASVLGTLSAANPPLLLLFWASLVVIASFLLRARVETREGASAPRDTLPHVPAGSTFLLLAGLAVGAVGAYASLRSSGPVLLGIVPFWALFIAFLAPSAIASVEMWMAASRDATPGAYALTASLLPSLGTYGLLRVCLPAAGVGDGVSATAMWLSLGVVLYGALKALARKDPAEVLSYVWLSRLGFAAFGIFTGSSTGIDGGILQIFNSALSTGALALVIGHLRVGTRISTGTAHGGLVRTTPRWVALFGIFVVSAFGFPGTAGFVADYLTLLGAFPHHPAAAVLGLVGAVLTAVGLISLFQRTAYGPEVRPGYVAPPDPHAREWVSLLPIPLATLVIGVGFFPAPMVTVIQGALHSLASTAW